MTEKCPNAWCRDGVVNVFQCAEYTDRYCLNGCGFQQRTVHERPLKLQRQRFPKKRT